MMGVDHEDRDTEGKGDFSQRKAYEALGQTTPEATEAKNESERDHFQPGDKVVYERTSGERDPNWQVTAAAKYEGVDYVYLQNTEDERLLRTLPAETLRSQQPRYEPGSTFEHGDKAWTVVWQNPVGRIEAYREVPATPERSAHAERLSISAASLLKERLAEQAERTGERDEISLEKTDEYPATTFVKGFKVAVPEPRGGLNPEARVEGVHERGGKTYVEVQYRDGDDRRGDRPTEVEAIELAAAQPRYEEGEVTSYQGADWRIGSVADTGLLVLEREAVGADGQAVEKRRVDVFAADLYADQHPKEAKPENGGFESVRL